MDSLNLPDELASKAVRFPECSYGAVKATVVLSDGSRIPDVILAWGQTIVNIAGKRIDSPEQLGFDIAMVQDVEAAL